MGHPPAGRRDRAGIRTEVAAVEQAGEPTAANVVGHLRIMSHPPTPTCGNVTRVTWASCRSGISVTDGSHRRCGGVRSRVLHKQARYQVRS